MLNESLNLLRELSIEWKRLRGLTGQCTTEEQAELAKHGLTPLELSD